jgi:voltage-gated potassium channel
MDELLAKVRLPEHPGSAVRAIGWRVLLAVAIITVVALVAYLDREGYKDNATGEPIGLLDCFYYATVSASTTGYGDIVPVTDSARLMTTLIVTPMRILFLILLVGTTLEVLATRSRKAFRWRSLRRRLHDHVVVCGYGVKARSALSYLEGADAGAGAGETSVIVIDTDPVAIESATEAELPAILGNATEADVLRTAGVDRAATVIVASERDDTNVLIVLRARELNRRATIIAACREEGNASLLSRSGADTVIVSADSAGRLLGMAASSPAAAQVIDDLLRSGTGLDVIEHRVGAVGAEPPPSDQPVAVRRGDELLAYEREMELRPDDILVCVRHVGDHIKGFASPQRAAPESR